MNYIPLTSEQKETIRKENGLDFIGEKIMFLLGGNEIATTDLLEGSTRDARFMAAEFIGVKSFDDYHLIRRDGQVLKASDIKGLAITDRDTDFGTDQGERYQKFLKRHQQEAMWREVQEILFKAEFDSDSSLIEAMDTLKLKFTIAQK